MKAERFFMFLKECGFEAYIVAGGDSKEPRATKIRVADSKDICGSIASLVHIAETDLGLEREDKNAIVNACRGAWIADYGRSAEIYFPAMEA